MLPLLNPKPRVSAVPIFDEHACIIVDDFVLEPEELVDYAANNHMNFQDLAGNDYPGPELPLGGTFAARVQDSFLQHARTPPGARRILDMKSRLSLVTRRPEDLLPGQRLPHRDFTGLPAGVGVGAMVLYLFRDERFGGTSFEKVLTIEPRYNRAIFYNGGIFHSGHIHMLELMVDDPRTGRLTANAFFQLRMAAG